MFQLSGFAGFVVIKFCGISEEMSWLISRAMMEACANSPSLPGLVAAYSADTCSDGAPSAPSERDAYAAAVLCQRQNDGLLPPFPVWAEVQTFNGYLWQGVVDVISGGFPCQDISSAGKGAGITGSRSGLWKEFARIIGEVRPRYVFVENSPILTSRGLDVVLGDLAALGLDAEWGVLSAADVGARHRRDRAWIVARDTNRCDECALSRFSAASNDAR